VTKIATNREIAWLPLLLCASVAVADGDGPTRKMTPAEAAAYDAVTRTVQSALSAPLPNYTAKVAGFDDKHQIYEALQAGQMFRMSFTATYRVSPEFAQAQAMAGLAEMTKGTPQQQKRMAELDAKDADLKKARDGTRDRAEKDRLRAELKAVHEEQNRLTDEVAAGAQARAASSGGAFGQGGGKALPPRELSVRIRLNQDVRVDDRAKPYRVAGAQTAFEQSEGCDDFGGACISVLIGPFEKGKKAGPATQYLLRNGSKEVATKPRGLMVVVSGPKESPDKVRELLGKVDLEKLASLLR
jgi:hypothetical protein